MISSTTYSQFIKSGVALGPPPPASPGLKTDVVKYDECYTCYDDKSAEQSVCMTRDEFVDSFDDITLSQLRDGKGAEFTSNSYCVGGTVDQEFNAGGYLAIGVSLLVSAYFATQLYNTMASMGGSNSLSLMLGIPNGMDDPHANDI